jgi:hypothetical protein
MPVQKGYRSCMGKHAKTLSLLLAFAAVDTSPLWADLRVSQPRMDVSQIRAGVPLTRTFELANTGVAEAEILDVHTSCGCLEPQVEPRIVPVGGTAKLTLSIRTLGQGSGAHTWRARVRYRADGKEGELAVAICARVTAEVIVQPAALTIASRGTMSQTVTLTDIRAMPLRITAVEPSTPRLRARLLGQGRDERGHWVGKICLDLAGELEPGRHVETLSIYTNDPVYPQLKVPVTIIRQSVAAVSALPEQVELRAAPGQSASCLVRLRARGDQPVRIRKIDAGHAALTCTWAAGPGADATLRVQLDSRRWNGEDVDATLQVHLETPAGESVSLPVRVRR